jgi:hypothetical protein
VQVHLIISRIVIVQYVSNRYHPIRVLNVGGVVIISTVSVLGKSACQGKYGHALLVEKKPSH